MSLLRSLGSQWREPELGKTIVVSTWRGILRVQAWPRKRGRAKSTDQANRQAIFAWYQRLVKRLGPKETQYEQNAIREYNRRNRGQRGSAAIRFRDWQTQRLYGRGVAVIVSPQLTLWPPAIARDASFILDWTTDEPGQILQRNGSAWGAINAPTVGQILTAGSTGQANTWQDPPVT